MKVISSPNAAQLRIEILLAVSILKISFDLIIIRSVLIIVITQKSQHIRDLNKFVINM